MSLRQEALSQAQALAGELTESQRAMLDIFCGAAIAALLQRLKEGIHPEDCREAFLMAAALQGAAGLKLADAGLEEFRAGDMTIRQGSQENAAQAMLSQAEALMRPYLRDSFCFAGV